MKGLQRRKSRRASRGAACHWFWGDERFVPHDHPDSNYRMARDALLSRVPIPEDNIHAVPTRGSDAGAGRGRI